MQLISLLFLFILSLFLETGNETTEETTNNEQTTEETTREGDKEEREYITLIELEQLRADIDRTIRELRADIDGRFTEHATRIEGLTTTETGDRTETEETIQQETDTKPGERHFWFRRFKQ